jgi:ankyrin repeat domain-containing protein 50
MRRIASAVGFDNAKQNIRALEIDSGMLEVCHRRFQQLQSTRNIEIHTFHETHGVAGISYLGLNHKVIPPNPRRASFLS